MDLGAKATRFSDWRLVCQKQFIYLKACLEGSFDGGRPVWRVAYLLEELGLKHLIWLRSWF